MKEATTAILKWQYEQLLKEMLLMENHLENQDSSCETEREMCIHKHLLIIEVYAKETIPLETDEDMQAKLQHLAVEAKMKRNAEEKKMSGTDQGLKEDDSEWVRAWRNQIIEDQGLAKNHAEWAHAWRKKFESRTLPDSETS
ncbi:hypothetical protein [Desulfonatronum thioautotrophicum]|uniref:hypothetical protein n=1 Tax=Desulfonatronum thioautotrophicum TaxID=617001 RepID=UPI0005EAC9AA|nr:hypothetical protein [Desulfonatronum thioautotrophicum]